MEHAAPYSDGGRGDDERPAQRSPTLHPFIPGMIRVVRPAENIAALAHVVLAALFGSRFGVVMGLAQRRKSIEGWKWIAASLDWDAVVNYSRRLDFANLKTGFA
jgi:hypothetical protein